MWHNVPDCLTFARFHYPLPHQTLRLLKGRRPRNSRHFHALPLPHCTFSRCLPAIQRRVNLRRATEKNFFVFCLLHIRRIAPKPAPSAGINCTWYNYFPLFRLQPSFGLTPHSMRRTQKHVYYTLSNPDSQVLFEKFFKIFSPPRHQDTKMRNEWKSSFTHPSPRIPNHLLL